MNHYSIRAREIGSTGIFFPYNRSGHCSQAVYSCSVCGVYDYGQRGGPGHADCENLCKEKP